MGTWQRDAVILATTGIMSWRQIAKAVKQPKSTVSDFLRQALGDKAYAANLKAEASAPVLDKDGKDNSRILFISDIHAPYNHKNMLPFLQGLKDKYKPTRVISLGDECDKSHLGYHESDPDLYSAGYELKAAKETLQALEKMFPVLDIIESNHGSMVYRKAKTHGIPRSYIKPYNEVLGVGDGWKWHHDMVLDLPDGQKVYVHHGKTADALKVSQSMGMSFVCGHFHESFGVKYWANPLGLYWAMNTGCLIDDKSLAFAYNNINLKRPIIGTGLVIDGVPVLEAMPL